MTEFSKRLKVKAPKKIYQKGKNHYKNQEYKKALEYFKKLLNYKNDHLSSLNYLSLCYAHLNNFKKTIKNLERGIEIDEDNEVFWMNLTKALFQVGNYKRVIKEARIAKKKFPDNEFFLNIFGATYLNLNKAEKAIQAFREALEINKRSKKAWKYLCKAYDMKGLDFKYDEYKPNTEVSWYFLAKKLMFKGFYDDAIYACNFALKINPSFAGAISLRDKIINAKQKDQRLQIERKKVIKERKEYKKKPPSKYTSYDEKMRKIRKRLNKHTSKRAEREETLDEKMEKVKERVEELKMEGSEYIESKNQIEKKPKKELEKDIRESEGKAIQIKEINKERTEPKTYLNNKKIDIGEHKFVIDGANVARYSDYGEDSIGRVDKLQTLIKTLDFIGITDYLVFFDRKLFYKIDDQEEYEKLLERPDFLEITGGTQADHYILQYAKKENAFIISNDAFREFYEVFGGDWIREKRITFQFINGDLFFDKIALI